MRSSSSVGKKNIEKAQKLSEMPQGFSMTIAPPQQKFIGRSR